MQLKSLEIQGFKSFADKIKLNFTNGITAVVGPNGSGKSNISDALRWVLGEQSTKTLRGSKMEDIIFNGTQIRKSQGFAQVSLIIDNSSRKLPMQTDEIIITRKLYRSGESEYKLNADVVRLKDIYELFMDTGIGRDGYCMIGQGKIAEIISAKSVQRRDIFEEAAGISKYRYKKIETEKRLELTQESLVRLKDIQIELESRILPLKTQSEKAQKFIELSSDKKQLEVSLWVQTIENSKKLLREQQDKLTIAKQDHKDTQEQLEKLEQRISAIFSTMQAYSLEVDAYRTKLTDKETEKSKVLSEIAVFENTIFHNNESIKRMQSEMQNFYENSKNMQGKMEDNTQKIQIHKAQITTHHEQYLQTLTQLRELDSQLQTLCNQITLSLNEKKSLMDTIHETKLKNMQSSSFLAQTTNRIANIGQEIDTKQETVSKIETQMKEILDLIDILNEKIACNQNSLSGYQIKYNAKKERLDQLQLQKNEHILCEKSLIQKAKLIQDMENSMDGFASSVKLILNYSKNGTLSGVYGTISQIITTKAEFATAIEIVLGGAMQNIVVKDDFTAKQAIELLKQNKSGRATFLPLNAIKGHYLQEKEIENSDGFIGFASDLVTYDSQFSNIIASLLGRIVVVSTIDHAIAMAKKYAYRFRIVTLDGQLLNVGGSLTGGFIAKSTGLLSRRNEIIALNEKANIEQQAISKVSVAIKTVQEELSFIESQIIGMQAERKTFGEDLIATNSEYKRLMVYSQDIHKGIATFMTELKKLEDDLKDKSQSSVNEESSLENLVNEHKAIVEKCSNLEDEKTRIQEKKEVLIKNKNQSELNCLGLRKDLQALETQHDSLVQQKQDTSKGLEQLQTQKETLQYKNQEVSMQISSAKACIDTILQEITQYTQKIEMLYSKRMELEQTTMQLRKSEKEVVVERETNAKEVVRLEERRQVIQSEYDSIIAKLWDEYEITRSQAQEFAVEIADVISVKGKLADIKNKIKNLGMINVAAIQEYEEVSVRYEFMKSQIQDIEQSKQQIEEMLKSLTQEMKDIFTENFTRINEHFSKIFVHLFGGGKAKLELVNPDDVLTSGIEIFVAPPGKIINQLSLLSGGEQSFIAIALYFAILKVRPSPFCFLDEIEAALDDVNVVKFANYLNKICEKTQFIIITHRRGTMEVADVLYGVTMQDEGVSKLIELNVSEIEAKLGIKSERV